LSTVLLDTGPLVAYLNAADRHHAWAAATLNRLPAPLLTCEAVIAEACHLLRPQGALVLELLERKAVRAAFDLGAETPAVRRLMQRYANVPMSLADACLVRLSELHADCRLVTLDSDFQIYRRLGRRTIPLSAAFA
jgi:predicted nucleic acid-binding protein